MQQIHEIQMLNLRIAPQGLQTWWPAQHWTFCGLWRTNLLANHKWFEKIITDSSCVWAYTITPVLFIAMWWTIASRQSANQKAPINQSNPKPAHTPLWAKNRSMKKLLLKIWPILRYGPILHMTRVAHKPEFFSMCKERDLQYIPTLTYLWEFRNSLWIIATSYKDSLWIEKIAEHSWYSSR